MKDNNVKAAVLIAEEVGKTNKNIESVNLNSKDTIKIVVDTPILVNCHKYGIRVEARNTTNNIKLGLQVLSSDNQRVVKTYSYSDISEVCQIIGKLN